MTKSIVISGPPAVGKTTVAKGLAQVFGLEYISGGDILKALAAKQGFDSRGDDWWDTADGMKFLQQRELNSKFDREIDDTLVKIFKQGGMVITSYTLPWLVRDGGGISIWLDGSHASSTQRMQSRDNMASKDAYEITKRRFDKNKALYKKLYQFDFGQDKSVFDLVIDTDNRSAQQVIGIAKNMVSELL